MKNSFFKHLFFYLIIEIFLVIIIFHELPEIGLISKIWIWHALYRLILLIWWFIRASSSKVKVKFFASYIPILAHFILHIYIWAETISVHSDWHVSNVVLFLSIIWIWLVIYRWELLIHRKFHCDSHHADTHKDCHDKDCEETH